MERLAFMFALYWGIFVPWFGLVSGFNVANISNDFVPQDPEVFYTAPFDSFIENLRSRPNGQILVSFNSNPDLYLVDPTENQTAKPIHHFAGYTSTLGIAETEENMFYVITGNYTPPPVFSGKQGSFSIWELDLRDFDPFEVDSNVEVRPSKIVDVPDAIDLNTLVTVNKQAGLLIAGDTATGTLFYVNVRDCQVGQLLTDPLLNRSSQSTSGVQAIGVDGLVIFSRYLYFSNLSKSFLGKIPLDTNSATLTGPPDVFYNTSSFVDGFVIDQSLKIYFTKPFSGVYFLHNGVERLVASYFGANNCLLDLTTLYFTFDDTNRNLSGIAKIDVSNFLSR